MNKMISGWPCDYCGEITPDWESTCEKCFEENFEEIMKNFLSRRGKRKRKNKNSE